MIGPLVYGALLIVYQTITETAGDGSGGRKAKYLSAVWEETSHMLLLPRDLSTAHFLALRLEWLK